MSDNGRERRRDTRLPAKLAVRYKVGRKIVNGLSTDLSENGVFIHTAQPAIEGTEVFMHINLGPGEPTIKAVGVVRRSIPAGIDSPGMGVEFLALYGIDKKALLRFLKVSLGREISEDAFGEVGTDHMLKFVFEPEESEGYGGTSPDQPLELAPDLAPRPPRGPYGTRKVQNLNQPDPRYIPVPSRLEREVTRNPRAAMSAQDKHNLAELRKLEVSRTGWYLALLLKVTVVLGGIGGLLWAASRDPELVHRVDEIIKKLIGN